MNIPPQSLEVQLNMMMVTKIVFLVTIIFHYQGRTRIFIVQDNLAKKQHKYS